MQMLEPCYGDCAFIIAKTGSWQFYSIFYKHFKITKYFYALSMLIDSLLYFYYKQIWSVSYVLKPEHFRVVEIAFYIEILHWI
jgi:hypothetical protein